MYGYIHLIALDCLLLLLFFFFFFFFLFDGLPGLTVCGGLLVSGLYRPGFQEMKEACKVRDKSSRALPIICTQPALSHPTNPHTFSLSTLLLSRIHSALNVAVNLLFFPLLIR
jgi:hypothetical protein